MLGSVFLTKVGGLKLGHLWVIAQEAGGGAEGGGAAAPVGAGSNIFNMLPLFIILYIVFYVLLIRPQRKQQKQHDNLLRELKKNDDVRTSGGIFGKVASIDADKGQVVLKVDESQNVKIRVLRSSIVAVIDRGITVEAPLAATEKSR